MSKSDSGKGDLYRPVNKELYDRNYERIFGSKLKYKEGDVIIEARGKNVIIPHVCNDIGYWGRGFTADIDKLNPGIGKEYREYLRLLTSKGIEPLGRVCYSWITYNFCFAGMIAQHGVGRKNKPLRYEALRKCMENVAEKAKKYNLEIFCPKFGSGLAGGDWNKIEEMIRDIWEDIKVTVWIQT